MANQTITQLPSAGPITGDELIPIVQNGQTVKTTAQSIAASPSQTQTFLTLNQEPTLPNSRRLAGGTGVGLTDNGAQSTLRIVLNAASGSLEAAGTGIVAKTASSTVEARTLTASGNGLGITNGDGVSGDPTFALTGVAAAVANLGGTGIMAIQNGTTVGGVQILGTLNQIAVANGNGTGNPTVSIVDNVVLPGTGSMTIPSGTDLEEPSGAGGQIRYNTDQDAYYGYSAGAWRQFSLSGGVTQIDTGTGLTGGPITSTGTISIADTGVTAASYGAASKTLVTTVNAQGQLTSLAETPIAIANTQVSGLGTASTLNAGVANGVATLDAGGTVPLSQIPASIQGGLIYQGTWNASTNTPTLTSGVGTKGYYYAVAVAGTTNLDGITDWNAGDLAVFNGTVWEQIDNTDAVTSVNGYTGTVVLTASDIGGLGTMATQNANNVAITGGTGTFTTVGIDCPTTDATFANAININAWVYSGKSKSVTAEETNPLGVFFKTDGTKMYITGSTGDDVNEYTLATAWDVSTATYTAVSTGVTQDTAPQDLSFKSDGLTMFVLGGTNKIVYQYTLSVAWSITTATYATKSFSVNTQETTPTGIWMKPDGSTMYIVGTAADAVFQYTLATPWDISTASYASKTYAFTSQEATASGIAFSDDGSKMYITGQSGDDIWQYDLATPWDVTTATPYNNFYIGFQENAVGGIYVDSTAANRVYVVGTTNDTVYQYNTESSAVAATTDKLFVSGNTSVNGNFVAGSNAYVDGTLVVQGTSTLSTTTVGGTLTASSTITLSGTTTSSTTIGTSATTGTVAIGGTTQTGAITVGQSTGAQTLNLATGATLNATTKTVNIGTTGVSGSTTNINIGSAVSGSLGTTTIQAPTVNIGQTATQFQVTNTASAVNYVRAVGAITGAGPTLSAQGSDTNIDFNVATKGTGQFKTTAVAVIGASAALAGAVNPVVAMTGTANGYIQSYIYNANTGISASADFTAYANNSTDAHGWADMGFTSSTYADPTYTVTGPNEAYLFGSALNSTYTGNLVYATDSTGSANAHQWYVGGFTQAKSAWKMQLTSTGLTTAGTVTALGGIAGGAF